MVEPIYMNQDAIDISRLEILINNELYSLVFSVCNEHKSPYYGVDTHDRHIYIFNTREDFYIRRFIDFAKRQYKR